MIDKNLRNINYLRISVTDMCNLRCVYCRPKDGLHLLHRNEILSFEEICLIVRHSVKLGIHKFRLTGGEPLVRKGIEHLISFISRIPGVDELAMTTNGILLKRFARLLKKSGLMRINISLDTLKQKKYSDITRGGSLKNVFNGIEEAKKAGFKTLKINVVVMAGINDDEIEDFARLTLDRDIEVRFIELMATRNKNIPEGVSFFPIDMVMEKIKRLWNVVPLLTNNENGPAKRFRIIGAKGSLGFINAVSDPFCANCNRLRLTSDGRLRSCLLEGGEMDIKSVIRSKYRVLQDVECTNKTYPRSNSLSIEQERELTDMFYKVIDMKPESHERSNNVLMYQVGG